MTLDEAQKAHVIHVLDLMGGNVARAARALDIERVTLHRKLRRWGISRERGEFVQRHSEAKR